MRLPVARKVASPTSRVTDIEVWRASAIWDAIVRFQISS